MTPRKPETGLFLLPEREKAIAKRQERPRYGLFLDRQAEKAIVSARQVLETAFSSTGREKRQLQAHAKSYCGLFFDRQGGKSIVCAPTEAAEVSQWLPEGRERIYIAFPRQVGGKVYFGPTPCYRLVPVRARCARRPFALQARRARHCSFWQPPSTPTARRTSSVSTKSHRSRGDQGTECLWHSKRSIAKSKPARAMLKCFCGSRSSLYISTHPSDVRRCVRRRASLVARKASSEVPVSHRPRYHEYRHCHPATTGR